MHHTTGELGILATAQSLRHSAVCRHTGYTTFVFPIRQTHRQARATSSQVGHADKVDSSTPQECRSLMPVLPNDEYRSKSKCCRAKGTVFVAPPGEPQILQL